MRRKINHSRKRGTINVRRTRGIPSVPPAIAPPDDPTRHTTFDGTAIGGLEKKNQALEHLKPVDPSEPPNGVGYQAGTTSHPNEFMNAQRQILPEPTLRLFCCYSHRDEDLRKRLELHLKPLERSGVITLWYDCLIGAGQDWKGHISDNLERADIILLLVSADFIASDYCYNIEMTRALARHEAGEAWVIPVIVRDVDWSDAPFGKLQALPKNGKAVARWPDRDAAWRNVVEGIKAATAELRRRKLL